MFAEIFDSETANLDQGELKYNLLQNTSSVVNVTLELDHNLDECSINIYLDNIETNVHTLEFILHIYEYVNISTTIYNYMKLHYNSNRRNYTIHILLGYC